MSSVPKNVDALGLSEAKVIFATGSGNTLRSDKAPVANEGAMKKAAGSSSAGSRELLLTLKKKRPLSSSARQLEGAFWRIWPPSKPSAGVCAHASVHRKYMAGGEERAG